MTILGFDLQVQCQAPELRIQKWTEMVIEGPTEGITEEEAGLCMVSMKLKFL